ncbi:MAG: ATP-binding cassette domain-containing protein, partial [Silvanigrellaceae bacterium]|nr:ATP-binding cassette domain-containing protein [Silvanigrellaceae bacterium]
MTDSTLKTKISIQDLHFFYSKRKVLDNINTNISPNKVTALIGPSGSGKSSLLRVFNRIFSLYPEQKAFGHVYIDGEDILQKSVSLDKLRTKVGMVFQKPTTFTMSIFENIAFGVRLHEKLPKKQMLERVEWALTEAALLEEVKHKLHEPAAGLSGGQQQRLCLARTIAIKPDIILLDEPTSALDPISTQKIESLILKLKKDFTLIL